MSTQASSKGLLWVLQWILILLHVTVIDGLNANITASNTTLTVGDSVTFTCNYIGSGTATGVFWYRGTVAGGIYLSLKPNATVPGTCNVFTASPSFGTDRVSHSCSSATKIYTLQIAQVQLVDNGKWSCTFQDPLADSTASEITLTIHDKTSNEITGTNEGVIVGAVCDAFGITEMIVGAYLIVVYQLYKISGLRKEAIAVIACEVLGVVQIALGSYLIHSKSQGLTGVVIAGIILEVVGFLILAVGVYFIVQYHWSKYNGNEVQNEETNTVVSNSRTDGKRQRHSENRGKSADDTGRKQIPPATHLRTQNNIELETEHTTFDLDHRRPLPLGPLPSLTLRNGTQEGGHQK